MRPLTTTILTAAAACFGAACASQHATPAPSPVHDTVRVVDTVTVAGRPDPATEARAASLQLRLLEQNALSDDLQDRLDDAMREVVRAMAKLQSLATRAEAASAMAEADVATRQLKGAGAVATAEAARAQKLLDLSNAEFQAQNFGGAVYLANQAKGVANAGKTAGAGASDTRPGEVLFAIPLSLEASGRGNVREGPGTTFKVAFAVEAGAKLTALSYVESWVRVQDDAGKGGWIFNTLLRAARH